MIETGSVLNGKYRLVRALGEGGMGTVYEARHTALGTCVAIKVLHPELARRTGLVERFLQEARVAAQIRSPHVVQVMDVDRTPEGSAYIVMELLEGEPLSTVLERQRKLAVLVACTYAGQILEALEAAHALGVIHRDLKPENVFVTFASGKPVLKLIDFGIAKARRLDPQQKSLTVAGAVMGTAEYMAPEQARSADKVDGRSDLYAVGVMLYEMIAGKRPVHGEDARIIALKVERGEVVPLLHAAPDTPREIAGLVHRAMAAHAALRFATATEMRLALEAAATGKRQPNAGWAGPGPGPTAGFAAHDENAGGGGGPPDGARRVATGPGGAEPPHVPTVRAPPITAAIAPLGALPEGYAGPPAPGFSAQGPLAGATGDRSRARGRTARALAWLAVPLLLGAGAVVYAVGGAGQTSPSAPSTPPVAVPEVTTVAAGTAAPTPAASAKGGDVPSLTPTKAPPAANHPVPPSHPSAHPSADAAAPSSPPLVFPPALPSVLPPFPSVLALPSGFPTSLPSGFPSALPGFPPWPSPATSATPAPASSGGASY